MWAVQKFRFFLKQRDFTVSADDTSLRWLLNVKGVAGCLARWALQLQAYDYEILRHENVSARIPTTLGHEPLLENGYIED